MGTEVCPRLGSLRRNSPWAGNYPSARLGKIHYQPIHDGAARLAYRVFRKEERRGKASEERWGDVGHVARRRKLISPPTRMAKQER